MIEKRNKIENKEKKLEIKKSKIREILELKI